MKTSRLPDWIVLSTAFLLTALIVDTIWVFLNAPLIAFYLGVPIFIGLVNCIEKPLSTIWIFARRILHHKKSFNLEVNSGD